MHRGYVLLGIASSCHFTQGPVPAFFMGVVSRSNDILQAQKADVRELLASGNRQLREGKPFFYRCDFLADWCLENVIKLPHFASSRCMNRGGLYIIREACLWIETGNLVVHLLVDFMQIHDITLDLLLLGWGGSLIPKRLLSTALARGGGGAH